jgi:hypothetical protein
MQFLGLELASKSTRMNNERRVLISEFQRHTHDVGSPEVVGKNVLCTIARPHHLIFITVFSFKISSARLHSC